MEGKGPVNSFTVVFVINIDLKPFSAELVGLLTGKQHYLFWPYQLS